MTDTLDPVDVDIAVRSDLWDDTLFAAALASAYPGDQGLVDYYFNAVQSAQHMEDLFRNIQGVSAQKGIVRLIR